MRRSASFSSFRFSSEASDAPAEPYYPEGSAKFMLRDSRLTIDFSLPSSPDAAVPLSYSAKNVLYFSRGNRVQSKNMVAADAVTQLCKLKDKHGDLKLLAAGGALLALATTKGVVQIWDTQLKTMVGSWTTKGVASMAWNGPVLCIGGLKGAIRQYDTRIEPISKMKEQVFKVTRHQAAISALSWNRDGRLLASGDESGIVYCWDARSKVPLDVGEFVQRRKKIQHQKGISALAWSPWQAKLLATGDISGTVKLWTIDAGTAHSNATALSKLELGSKIVNLHFSPNYKELVTTLGSLAEPPEGIANLNRAWPRGILSNAIVVHSFPTLRQVSTASVSEQDACGSILHTAGAVHKLVVAVPGESKLKVFDVWGKRKEVRRQSSSLGNAIR
ncbi:WD40 repeat-like protein [Mycena maculata]|uniref:WD40 repeat-like protein n=1 Tax=Mycena maculata TaxID=230809 RepID=A0AAD7HX23_9AGAR|nr:WD40 repeat-like protein [Mycena maculata]